MGELCTHGRVWNCYVLMGDGEELLYARGRVWNCYVLIGDYYMLMGESVELLCAPLLEAINIVEHMQKQL